LFGELAGRVRKVLARYTVSLPNKHGRGGQSAARFGRIRMEKRHNYLTKIAEDCSRLFLNGSEPSQYKGIVIAGTADLKYELSNSDVLDPRIKRLIVRVVDTAYGGSMGFAQAIELSSSVLGNARIVHEGKILRKFFDEIGSDSETVSYGVEHVLHSLDLSAIETLIISESFAQNRVVLKNKHTGEHVITCMNEDRLTQLSYIDWEVLESVPFLRYLTENEETRKGCAIEMISNVTAEAQQFKLGFDGIGAFLRFKVDYSGMASLGVSLASIQLVEVDLEDWEDHEDDTLPANSGA
jgi:peptide chain release factor subunit 1